MPNLLLQAMTWQSPEKLPVRVGILPAAWRKNYDGLSRLAEAYPGLMPKPPKADSLDTFYGGTYHKGTHVDEWGCVWSNLTEGMEAYVTGHPVKTREDIRSLQIPPNRDGRLPHGFMYLRLLDLRGFEEAMFDFADECEELQILIDKVLEYNMIQIDAVCPRAKDWISFGDDLGTQHGLAIGADKWRKYMKPCFMQMYQKVRNTGLLVYMHTDGCIYEIMPDLVECGANMINPQFRANTLDHLERVCKGKIPIDLDLDRQLFPFATPAQLEEHVRESVERLWLPQGGLGLSIEIGQEVPMENIDALLAAARKWREYKG
jgi:hypothetical protein